MFTCRDIFLKSIPIKDFFLIKPLMLKWDFLIVKVSLVNATVVLAYENNPYKTGVINDPLGQPHSQASSEHCFLLFWFSRFEKWGRTHGRTTCAKTMIPTDRDFGSASWINTVSTSDNICTVKKCENVIVCVCRKIAFLALNNSFCNMKIHYKSELYY